MKHPERPEVDAQPAVDPLAGAQPTPSAPRHSADATVWTLSERVASWTGHQLARPRVRTTVAGIVLILIAALFVGHSFWTAPLVIVGALMIVVAWLGSRMEGRFAVEWSETGTGFEMSARFKSASAAATQLTAGQPTAVPSLATSSVTTSVPATPVADADTADVIDGEAHTMEIDAAELRAIVAAIEQVAPLAHRANASTSSADEDVTLVNTAAPSNGHRAAAHSDTAGL